VRVAIDATPLLGSRTGVATFTGGLLRALGASGAVDVAAFALSLRGRGRLAGAVPPGVAVLGGSGGGGRPMPAGLLTRWWARSPSWPPLEAFVGGHDADAVDVVHGTNYVVPPSRGAAEVVTVYDLTSVRFPELCTPASLRYPRLVQRAVDRGAWVHVLATAIGDEVVELLGVDRDRVRVVPSGVDPPTAGDAAAGRRIAGHERYVLFVGTAEPRKRLPDLVRAFDDDAVAGARPGLGLVIAGPDGWGTGELVETMDAARHGRAIRRIGWVDEATRADLLAGASVVAVPSVYEGFGYPPLEAMAAGVPVVATSVGSLPEVLGDAADLVPPADVDALAAAIARVLDDDAHRAALVERGRARAASFSWEQCAKAMVALYEDADAAR
jgi:glycosyltransferase involved in cell wall biosynthesis